MFKIWTPNSGVFALARTILKQYPQAQLQLWHGGMCPEGAHTEAELQKILFEKTPENVVFCGDERKFSQKNMLPVGILCDLADRGLTNSVEFRRFARKLLRPCRNRGVRTVVFLGAVLASSGSCKQLAKTLGTKFKTVFLTDFIFEKWKIPGGERRQLEIITTGSPEIVRELAEKMLQTKLAVGVVKYRSES